MSDTIIGLGEEFLTGMDQETEKALKVRQARQQYFRDLKGAEKILVHFGDEETKFGACVWAIITLASIGRVDIVTRFFQEMLGFLGKGRAIIAVGYESWIEGGQTDSLVAILSGTPLLMPMKLEIVRAIYSAATKTDLGKTFLKAESTRFQEVIKSAIFTDEVTHLGNDQTDALVQLAVLLEEAGNRDHVLRLLTSVYRKFGGFEAVLWEKYGKEIIQNEKGIATSRAFQKNVSQGPALVPSEPDASTPGKPGTAVKRTSPKPQGNGEKRIKPVAPKDGAPKGERGGRPKAAANDSKDAPIGNEELQYMAPSKVENHPFAGLQDLVNVTPVSAATN